MSKYKDIKSFNIGSTETSAVYTNEGVLTAFVVTGSVISGSLVSFLVSTDGTNYYPLLKNDSTEVTLTVSASPRAYAVDYFTFKPWNYIKGRLGASGSAKAQATYISTVEFIYEAE